MGGFDYAPFDGDLMGTLVLTMYLFVTLVLLLNLVIAVLSNVYESIKDDAVPNWCLQYAGVIADHQRTHSLVVTSVTPPFNTIAVCFVPLFWMSIRTREACSKLRRRFTRSEDESNSSTATKKGSSRVRNALQEIRAKSVFIATRSKTSSGSDPGSDVFTNTAGLHKRTASASAVSLVNAIVQGALVCIPFTIITNT